MPKQKKQYTLEEVAEKLRELNSQPAPYRRMMVTDDGRRAGMKYFRKGSAWRESLKRLYEEDRERRNGRINRAPVAAPTTTTTITPPAAPSAPTQVANGTPTSDPFFFENNDGDNGDDGYYDCPDDNPVDTDMIEEVSTPSVWEEYKDRLVEMYLDVIAFGKSSIGLEAPEVPEFNCDCIKHARKIHVYTLSSNILSFIASFNSFG